MPEESQKRVIGQGITQNVEIEKYRQENLEPNSVEIKVSFRLLDIGKYDKSTVTRVFCKILKRRKFGYNSMQLLKVNLQFPVQAKLFPFLENSFMGKICKTIEFILPKKRRGG